MGSEMCIRDRANNGTKKHINTMGNKPGLSKAERVAHPTSFLLLYEVSVERNIVWSSKEITRSYGLQLPNSSTVRDSILTLRRAFKSPSAPY